MTLETRKILWYPFIPLYVVLSFARHCVGTVLFWLLTYDDWGQAWDYIRQDRTDVQ